MDVRSMVLAVCVGVFVVVAAIMLVLAWRHHRKPGKEEANFHPSVVAELGWTLTTLLMVVALAWPTLVAVWGH